MTAAEVAAKAGKAQKHRFAFIHILYISMARSNVAYCTYVKHNFTIRLKQTIRLKIYVPNLWIHPH